MEEINVRASKAAPTAIPNANDMMLSESLPQVKLHFEEYDDKTSKLKTVSRTYEKLNPEADAKDIYDFATMLAEITTYEQLGTAGCVVINKTEIMM